MRSLLAAGAVMVLTALCGSASAEIIFDNGNSTQQGGLPGVDELFMPADDFVLQAGSDTITGIQWTGFYAPEDDKVQPVDAFTVFIFASDGDSPTGAPLHTLTNTVTSSATGNNVFGEFPEYQYTMAIDPLQLTAGTTYWLAIVNDITFPDKGTIPLPDVWFWSYSNPQTGSAHQKLIAVWVNVDRELDFKLTGGSSVVPEPASLTILGLGLVGIAARRKFFRS